MSFPTTRSARLITRAACAAAMLLMASATFAFAADRGLLGNELDELQKAVDAVSPATVAKDPTDTLRPPDDKTLSDFIKRVVPPGSETATTMRNKEGGVVVIPPGKGDDNNQPDVVLTLPDGTRLPPGSVIRIPDGKEMPPGTTITVPGDRSGPPVTVTVPGGAVIPPPADPGSFKPAIVPTKGTIDDDAFEFDRKTGASLANGLLVFNAPDEDHSPVASHSRNLKGDFDLRVDYTLEATDAKKLVGAAFGIRLDSPTREQQVTVDRRIDEGGDKVLVSKSREIKPVFSAKPAGLGGVIRVQRRGDHYKISHGNADGSQWTDLGDVTVPLTDEVNFWMIGFTDWGGVRVTVSRVEVTKPGE